MSEQAAPSDFNVGSVAKNSRERVAVMLRIFKGHRFVTIRVVAATSQGSLIPTAKGVALKADALPALIKPQEAHAGAVRYGWRRDDDA